MIINVTKYPTTIQKHTKTLIKTINSIDIKHI